MTPPLVLYHRDCMDGFASAAVAARYLSRRRGGGDVGDVAEFVACRYGDPCPVELARGREVYVVDFSWPLAEMRTLREASSALVWVDHHETSAGAAAALASESRFATDIIVHRQDACGAVLTWELLVPESPVPTVLRFVDDRDRWQWKLERSAAVSAGLSARWLASGAVPDEAVALGGFFDEPMFVAAERGEWLLKSQAGRVSQALGRCFPYELAGLDALACNATSDASEVAHAMLECSLSEVAVVYWRTGVEEWTHSLRSRKDGPNVAKIAEAFGGGGHPHAAGFKWSKGLPWHPSDGSRP